MKAYEILTACLNIAVAICFLIWLALRRRPGCGIAATKWRGRAVVALLAAFALATVGPRVAEAAQGFFDNFERRPSVAKEIP